jgi:phosphonate metabolism protein PhnN/1,5-bisphosphokinase (PRPP-forming)
MSGMLVLVAGPSGAGKDTLIRLARERLRDDQRFVFVRRAITRPGDAGGEDHEPVTRDEFARREAGAEFLLSWDAHGLRYGVPGTVEADLAEGRVVIVNVSRGVIAEATQRFPNSRLVIVTAPAEMLAARLALRGREPASEHQARLARPHGVTIAQDHLMRIDNDGTPQAGAEALIAILHQCLPRATSFPPLASAGSDGPSTKVETTA